MIEGNNLSIQEWGGIHSDRPSDSWVLAQQEFGGRLMCPFLLPSLARKQSLFSAEMDRNKLSTGYVQKSGEM